MRLAPSGVLAVLIGLTFVGATAVAASDQDQEKKGRKKQAEAEKVELTALPAAVAEAAKKECPAATFTRATKQSTKKQGAIYTLEGTDGKYQVSLQLSSSGELQRLTKALQRKRDK